MRRSHAHGRAGRAYEPVADIAKGGMGCVELVVRREGSFARVYAMKRLRPELSEDREVREMFLEEARIAGLIRHPNVVPVLDVGEDDLGPYLVMDYVEGVAAWKPLVAAREAGRRLPVAFCTDVARQAAHGLAAAHELEGAKGRQLCVVHRDISPQNILLGFDGLARVTDFGVARALDRRAGSDAASIAGKLGYMSPEQLQGRPLDARSDLFSLGVVLYELLAGRRLYAGGPSGRDRGEPVPDIRDVRPDVPEALAALTRSLLAEPTGQRPESARLVAARLEVIHAGLRDAGEAVSIDRYLLSCFASERARQRALLSAALERTEAEIPAVDTAEHDEARDATARLAPSADASTILMPPQRAPGSGEDARASRVRRNAHRPARWWWLGGVAACATAAIGWGSSALWRDGAHPPEPAAAVGRLDEVTRAPAIDAVPSAPTIAATPAPSPPVVEPEPAPSLSETDDVPAPDRAQQRPRRRRRPRQRPPESSLAKRAWGWNEGGGR